MRISDWSSDVCSSDLAAQPLASAGWGVAESSEHKEEAVALVEFLSSGEAPLTFAKGNSLIPILTSAQDDPFFSAGPWATYVAMNEQPETYMQVIQPRGVESDTAPCGERRSPEGRITGGAVL